jgi:hypothetical protein
MADDWRSTFLQLRKNFESLALQSNGLHHILTERKQGMGIIDTPDDGLPPGLAMGPSPGRPHQVLSLDSPLGVPPRPRELSSDERAAVPPASEKDRYIRDGRGRALAIWEPAILRSGFIYGDHAVLPRFKNVADAAGNAMLGIPNISVSRFPEDIRPLFRPSGLIARRYVFGVVPSQPTQFMAIGWSAGGMVFDEGVIIDNPEQATGGTRDATWLLLLHMLGWDAPSGALLRATCRYWSGHLSVTFSRSKKFQAHAGIPKVPLDRFYSELGSTSGGPTDICWASAWAIDKLLSITSDPPSEESKTTTPSIELSDTQKDILEAIRKNPNLTTIEKVAAATTLKYEPDSRFRGEIATLKRFGVIDKVEGRYVAKMS